MDFYIFDNDFGKLMIKPKIKNQLLKIKNKIFKKMKLKKILKLFNRRQITLQSNILNLSFVEIFSFIHNLLIKLPILSFFYSNFIKAHF